MTDSADEAIKRLDAILKACEARVVETGSLWTMVAEAVAAVVAHRIEKSEAKPNTKEKLVELTQGLAVVIHDHYADIEFTPDKLLIAFVTMGHATLAVFSGWPDHKSVSDEVLADKPKPQELWAFIAEAISEHHSAMDAMLGLTVRLGPDEIAELERQRKVIAANGFVPLVVCLASKSGTKAAGMVCVESLPQKTRQVPPNATRH